MSVSVYGKPYALFRCAFFMLIPFWDQDRQITMGSLRASLFLLHRQTFQEDKPMRGLYTGIEQLIGNTPTLRLDRIRKALDLKADIVAKLE